MIVWLDEADGGVSALTTSRSDGNFANSSEWKSLSERRRAVVDREWVWIDQVHGSDVIVATASNLDDVRGATGDSLVTSEASLVLTVQTADCLPAVFHSAEGVIGVAHAGWRGMASGVIERTADVMRSLGATEIIIEAGPSIGPECYEFSEVDLAQLATRFGNGVRAMTTSGRPSLDLRETLRIICGRSGLSIGTISESCTACNSADWFSHRARREAERMATMVWRVD